MPLPPPVIKIVLLVSFIIKPLSPQELPQNLKPPVINLFVLNVLLSVRSGIGAMRLTRWKARFHTEIRGDCGPLDEKPGRWFLRSVNTYGVPLRVWARWNRVQHSRGLVQACVEAVRCRKKWGNSCIGISTPEHDQNAVIDLMREGWVDTVQLIYNIFSQEAQEELFAEALKHRVGVIVRVAFDESSLTGKLTESTQFAEGDIRRSYFAGDRLQRTVRRVEAIRRVIAESEPDMPTAALKFALKPSAVSTVIAGIRNQTQAEKNCAVGNLEAMSDELEAKLREHYWRRAFWHQGK